MFKIGDLIVYGNSGVCRVEKIGPPELKGVPADVDYYTLMPLYSSTSRILTPVNNERVVMRPVISADQANEVLESISVIACIEIEEEKHREDTYKDVMKNNDCKRIVGLLKTIQKRKEQRIAEGKKITASDEKYFNMASDKLCGELAVVLGKDKNQIRETVLNRVQAFA